MTHGSTHLSSRKAPPALPKRSPHHCPVRPRPIPSRATIGWRWAPSRAPGPTRAGATWRFGIPTVPWFLPSEDLGCPNWVNLCSQCCPVPGPQIQGSKMYVFGGEDSHMEESARNGGRGFNMVLTRGCCLIWGDLGWWSFWQSTISWQGQ